jgi:hypothetical protein
VLAGIEALTILTEMDATGANARAAQDCADRWIAVGKEVFFADPAPDCGDMNDALIKMVRRA